MMQAIDQDQDSITIRFTRDEIERVRSAMNYVASLFPELDREALDGYRMTPEAAEETAEALTTITTTTTGRQPAMAHARR